MTIRIRITNLDSRPEAIVGVRHQTPDGKAAAGVLDNVLRGEYVSVGPEVIGEAPNG